MYYPTDKHAQYREQLKQQLLALGWEEQECEHPVTDEVKMYAKYDSPHVGSDCGFWFESCLKAINSGEAVYALEMRLMDVEHLAWRCDQENPNNHHPLDTLDAFLLFRNMLLDGIDFDYHREADEEGEEDSITGETKGNIRLIDWEHPKRNEFVFVENWRGALNDKFGWDFILCVNAMPVAAIIIQEDKPEDEYPCEAALNLAQYQLDNDFQFPCYCHAVFVSNGKQMMKGGPFRDADELEVVDSLADILQPGYFLKHCVKNMEY